MRDRIFLLDLERLIPLIPQRLVNDYSEEFMNEWHVTHFNAL